MACQLQRFIKMTQRSLGLDDDAYRDFLESVTGKRSTKDMTKMQRWRVVEALKRKGANFVPVGRTAEGEPDASQNQSGQALKIRSLWLTLKGYGVLRDSSEWALLSYVGRQTGRPGEERRVRRMEWCTAGELQTVIESLKKWVRRIEDDLAAAAGETGALAPRQPGEDYDAWQARRRLYLENYTPAKRAA